MAYAPNYGDTGVGGIWNPDEQYNYDPDTGQYNQQKPGPIVPAEQAGFDASKTPAGVPQGWAEDFIKRNPGDYSRIGSAYQSDIDAKQQYLPQNQSPTQQWNQQPAVNTQTQGRSDELFKMLMERATQGTAVNRNDPNIRSQVDPVVAQQERASRNYLDDLAERSGPLANLQGERRLASERSGQAAGAFESEVVGREISAKRDEIAQALQLYGSQLGQDKQLEMQNQLAQLDAMLRREGYGVQREGLALQKYGMDQGNDQFMRTLALNEWDTTNKWDYAWSRP